jgi:hypothetical protein
MREIYDVGNLFGNLCRGKCNYPKVVAERDKKCLKIVPKMCRKCTGYSVVLAFPRRIEGFQNKSNRNGTFCFLFRRNKKPVHFSKSMESEYRVVRRSGVWYHVADVFHSGQVHDGALKAEAKSGVRERPEFSHIEIPGVFFNRHF